ncbi:(deoxy)nucleoside triphosphate pyrophosphohydrolase [Cryptosporangium aurantiacum]|uniref:8-oxo-dGTP diphosphatase n=1 Tax=Cryptosporangium aurantiacum TaxID=134849 RepID=A0A1M7QQV1_9ACTN|nr:(deoxy)nucleoside triphosphate pyrophosphohydrolase [Cryptosporangium aurantiacum]SHN33844.1 8-oxo-dGTP diphosphatase [Cryptosporangium aurantiacum]
MSNPLPPVSSAPLIVVGAAIVNDRGQVLAAQRAEPPALAGCWEFPGGKVEPGESDVSAIVRECREELGVEVELVERLGPDLPLQRDFGVLRVWIARLAEGEPTALEHAALRWLDATELDDVAWLPADAPLIDELRVRLAEWGG